MDERSKQLIIENLSFLKELETRLTSFQNVNIDLIRIIYFLTQFQCYDEIKIVIALLKRIDFLDSNMITYLLKSAYDKIDNELLSNPIISSLGGIQDSSAVICYQLLKNLFDDEEETLKKIVNIESLGSHITSDVPSSLILFDDNITSGTQLEAFFEELIIGSEKPEFFKKPLTSSNLEILKKIPIRICYAIQLSESSNHIIEKIRLKYQIDLKVYSGKVDYNNYLDFQSNVFQSIEESTYAKKFISEIAKQLYADKNWSKETVYSRLLGYGNLGKLTTFYYNVPKSLIPIFWKFGYYNNQPWFPLIPETQEVKKITTSQEKLDFIKVDAIKNWISTGTTSRKPILKFGVFVNGSVVDEVNLKIPSRKFFREKFIYPMGLKKVNYIENIVNPNRGPLAHLRSSKFPKSILTPDDYNSYKLAVDNYNNLIEDYLIEFEEYLFRISSMKTVEFILENEGNTPANNFVLKFFYNTGTLVAQTIVDFCPQFTGKVPDIDKFYTRKPGEIYVTNNQSNDWFSTPNIIKSKHTPIVNDTEYVSKIQDRRLGHNDNYRTTITFTRFDFKKQQIDVPFELNFDEDPNTIDGIIKFNYEEVDEIDIESQKLLNDAIRKFDEIIKEN